MISLTFRRAVEAVVNRMLGQWQDWTPTYGASGSMTYGSITTNVARYKRIGNTVFFCIDATGTTGGSASNGITFTLPVETKNANGLTTGAGRAVDGGVSLSAFWFTSGSTTVASVRKYDSSNYGLGAGRAISLSGCYEAA